MQRWSVGEIKDVEAYVAQTVARSFPAGLSADERVELLADGLEFVARVETTSGHDPVPAIRAGLQNHLRDAWRRRTPEWRRNTRAGTSRMIVATGLSHEHGAINDSGALGEAERWSTGASMAEQERIVEQKLAYQAITRPQDLRSPRLVGQLFGGVPSHGVVPSSKVDEVFDAIHRERLG